MNIENSHLSHIFMLSLFRERLMHLPLISFLTELWHLLDVSAVAGHVAVLAAGILFLFFFFFSVVLKNLVHVNCVSGI